MSSKDELRKVWNLFQYLKRSKAKITRIELRGKLQNLNIQISSRRAARVAEWFGAAIWQNRIEF